MGVVVSAGGSVLRGQVRVTGGPWEPVGMRSLPGRRGVGPPRVHALGPADTGPQAQGTLAAPVAVGLSTHAVAPDAAPAVARSPQWGSSHCPLCPPYGPRVSHSRTRHGAILTVSRMASDTAANPT